MKDGDNGPGNEHTPAVLRRHSRRTFIKGAAIASAAPIVLASRESTAQDGDAVLPPSPPTTPWVQFLPNEPSILQESSALSPAPTEAANTAAQEVGRAAHQRFQELTTVPPQLYQLRARRRNNWIFNPAYPAQRVWGFEGDTRNGAVLNPTIVARYGQAVICRLRNDLPGTHQGFGTPEVSMHLHNLHTPSESDGFPGDYFSATKAGPTLGAAGQWKDHFYPNVCAGLDEFGGIGDPREALGTLWYHDHTLDFTAPNASRGLAGAYLLYDALDSGDENDSNPGALRLPSGAFDYPLLFQDKRFNGSGIHIFDQLDPDGTLGDKVTVNGLIEPVLRVARRKYRFRLINAGPTRFYHFVLVHPRNGVRPVTYIANDGNLLPAPIFNHRAIRLGVAERADVVIDFSQYPLGTMLHLVNRLAQDSTRGPGDVVSPGTPVLRFHVDRNPPQPDRSVVPPSLRPLRPVLQSEVDQAPVRRWEFGRSGGVWTVNEEVTDVLAPRAMMARGAAEVWELVNPSGGWSHPVHIHFEEGRILQKFVDDVPVAIPAHERGRKDVFVLGPNTTMRVFIRFRDFVGKYVMHCHNVVHEDHAMMIRFDIV